MLYTRNRLVVILEYCYLQGSLPLWCVTKEEIASNMCLLQEADVLKAIKKLAVRQENVMVARVQLHNMAQDQDEPIRAFYARLNWRANILI